MKTLKNEINNFEEHCLYPCSIIDVIRNFIKVESKNAKKSLPLLIESILKYFWFLNS